LHIRGSECDDFVFHLFLPCCSIAQEAREANIKIDKKLDLISGDDLSSIVFPQHQSNHLDNRQAYESNSLSESSLSYSLLSRLNTVSSTSRWIITLSMLVAIRFLVSIVLFGDPLNIAVLVLVFAQPLLILYFFYWRYHRSHASLDYVIKLFAVGFFMSTFQSVVFESILETILGFVFVILLMLVDPKVVQKADKDANSASTSPRSFLEALLPSSSSRMIDPASSLRLRQLVHSTVHVMHGGLHSETAAKGGDGNEDDGGIFSPDVVRRNFPLVVVALLVMAFVIAAGVEETMKHFAIRCCRFPASLRDPHSIRIYLMTAALGFATAENIEYVFGSKGSPFAGTSAFEGELLILLIRIAMPVHIICSVLQSITLSKVLMGLSNSKSIFYVSSTTEYIALACS
jgi:RsiW-degrading membrane proteinase PrsW (M82 family)